MTMRRIAALLALLLLAAPAAVTATQQANTDDAPKTRARPFVRQPDTLCAAASDTLQGPSVFCYAAKAVIWKIRANAGTCSLITIEVSNNDTAWSTPPNGAVDVISEMATGDSLNTGGRTAMLATANANLTANGVIPWRYCRAVVRRRVGFSTSTVSAGPTVACRTRVDSLRWNGAVVWSTP